MTNEFFDVSSNSISQKEKDDILDNVLKEIDEGRITSYNQLMDEIRESGNVKALTYLIGNGSFFADYIAERNERIRKEESETKELIQKTIQSVEEGQKTDNDSLWNKDKSQSINNEINSAVKDDEVEQSRKAGIIAKIITLLMLIGGSTVIGAIYLGYLYLSWDVSKVKILGGDMPLLNPFVIAILLAFAAAGIFKLIEVSCNRYKMVASEIGSKAEKRYERKMLLNAVEISLILTLSLMVTSLLAFIA